MHIVDILEVKLDRQHNTSTSWLVIKIKEIVKTPIYNQDKPIFSFKIRNEAVARNIKILTAFYGNLCVAIVAPKDIPLKYGSKLRNIVDLSILSYYHEDKVKIINIIQKCLRYHLDPIKEGERKSDLDAIILRGNHKSSR